MASERVQRQVDRLLGEAEEAVVRHRWDVVRARAESVLAFDPDNADPAAFVTAADWAKAPTAPPPPSAIEQPSATAAQPSSFANGRYEVKDFLGEGGRKRVYRAHDSVQATDGGAWPIRTSNPSGCYAWRFESRPERLSVAEMRASVDASTPDSRPNWGWSLTDFHVSKDATIDASPERAGIGNRPPAPGVLSYQ